MPIATTNLALPRLRLMELVAACPTFRTVVGAADSAEAMVHILSPYADDHLVDTMFEGSPVLDGAGNKVQELKEPRPRAIINHNEYDRQLLGTAFGASKINHILCFEFLPDPAAGADINVGLALFEEQVGKILDEMEERRGADKLAGEDVFTELDSTHLNLTEYSLVMGPAESNPEEELGVLFYTLVLLVDAIG